MRSAWHLGFLATHPILKEILGFRLVARVMPRQKKWQLHPKNFLVAKVLVWTLQVPLRQQALAQLDPMIRLATFA